MTASRTSPSSGPSSGPDSGIVADPWRALPAMVEQIHSETPGVRTYQIQLMDVAHAEAYSARPGQFNMLYLPGVGEAAISISGYASAGSPLLHTVRAVGNVTRALAGAKAGFPLGIRGPFGSHWPLELCQGRDLIVVAGGIGLAPLRPVIYEVLARREQFGRVSLLVGARTPADLLYQEEYAQWVAAGIHVETTVDRAEEEWSGHVGVVTLLLNRLELADPARGVLFTCGPEVMMTYAIQEALRRGIPSDHTWLSLERHMNCAIGHCGHCQFGPHFICKNGPVLRYDQVDDLMRVSSL